MYVFFTLCVCLKRIEKALGKYPPNCEKEEGNSSDSVPLFPTSVVLLFKIK